MTESTVDLRVLLGRPLPLEGLRPPDRGGSRRSLRAELAEPLERAGHFAQTWLASSATVVPPARRAPAPRDGILAYAPDDLPDRARLRLALVRRLIRLEDALLSSAAPQKDARTSLIERLTRAGREMIGAGSLHFHPPAEEHGGEPRSHAGLVEEARSRPGTVFYCPDVLASARLRSEPRRRDARSLAAASVTSSEGEALGVVEASGPDPDAFGPEALAMVGLVADTCAALLDRASRIERLVFFDDRTSLPNNRYFDRRLADEMARADREKGPMALCIADIDNFKRFNDEYSYLDANRVLAQVGQALRGAVRPFDAVARWGGEEFAVILTAPVQAEDVAAISERLRGLVERQEVEAVRRDGRPERVGVTVSIGVARYPDHGRNRVELWEKAERALKIAKKPPKNRVVIYGSPACPATDHA